MSERWATIPDWDEKQHYKTGRSAPPWIKLHTNIIRSRRFQTMPLASKALAPMVWLLAAKNNGRVDVDVDELEFQLHWPRDQIEDGLNGLIKCGYLLLDSEMIAPRKHEGALEEETEEETEENKKDAPSGARDDATRETLAPKTTPKSELMAVLDERRAEAFIEHRKKIKRPMTAHAARLLAKQFAQAPPPMTANDAADMTIANGWQGFRPEYVKNVDRTHSHNGQRTTPGVMDDLRDLADRAKEFDDRRRESLRGDGEEPRRRVLGAT